MKNHAHQLPERARILNILQGKHNIGKYVQQFDSRKMVGFSDIKKHCIKNLDFFNKNQNDRD